MRKTGQEDPLAENFVARASFCIFSRIGQGIFLACFARGSSCFAHSRADTAIVFFLIDKTLATHCEIVVRAITHAGISKAQRAIFSSGDDAIVDAAVGAQLSRVHRVVRWSTWRLPLDKR